MTVSPVARRDARGGLRWPGGHNGALRPEVRRDQRREVGIVTA